MPEIFAQLRLDTQAALEAVNQLQKQTQDTFSGKSAQGSANVFKDQINDAVRLKTTKTELMAVTMQEIAGDKALLEVQKAKIVAMRDMKTGAMDMIRNDKDALKTMAESKREMDKYNTALKESANAMKQNALVKDKAVDVEKRYAEVLKQVANAEISNSDAAKKMKGIATANYQEREKMLAQAGKIANMSKEEKQRYKELGDAMQLAMNKADKFSEASKRMSNALKDSEEKTKIFAKSAGSLLGNFGSLTGAFGEFGKIPGLVANSLNGAIDGIEKFKTADPGQKIMAGLNLGMMGVQLGKQLFDSIDQMFKGAEQKIIDKGKDAFKVNLELENFNIGNKGLAERIDLVNKLKESNPKLAASLRGVIGDADAFDKAIEKGQSSLNKLREAGAAMEWKTEQSGGGVLGWLRSLGNTMNETAKLMGSFLTGMEDFRTGVSTGMSKGSEAMKSFQSSVEGWKNRSLQLDIQIAEKQGNINKSHDLQIKLIEAEGDALQKNLNTTILLLEAEMDKATISSGERSVELVREEALLRVELSRLKNNELNKGVWNFINSAVKQGVQNMDDLWNKSTKIGKEWSSWIDSLKASKEYMARGIGGQLSDFAKAVNMLTASGTGLEGAIEAVIQMRQAGGEISSGISGLDAVLKELKDAYKAIPDYTQDIIYRQKILWDLEEKSNKSIKEKTKELSNQINIINNIDFSKKFDFGDRTFEFITNKINTLIFLIGEYKDVADMADQVKKWEASIKYLQGIIDNTNSIMTGAMDYASGLTNKWLDLVNPQKSKGNEIIAYYDGLAKQIEILGAASGLAAAEIAKLKNALEIDKEIALQAKEDIDLENQKNETRKKTLATQDEYYKKEKSIQDMLAKKRDELNKAYGLGTSAADQIREIGKAAGMSTEQIDAFVKELDFLQGAIDEVTAAKKRLDEANKTADSIQKKLTDRANKLIDDREFAKVNEFMNKAIQGFPQVLGYTDDMFKKFADSWEDINRKVFDTTKQLEDERASFEIALNEQVKAGKISADTAKLWLEEYDKMMMETLKKEDEKRIEIVKTYADGLNKALETEQTKLDKMLDDFNKRMLDREKQTQDAKLKLGDYVYRQTHTAEENAVRDAVSNYQKEYEEFRKAGVAKEDLAQWQTLKQKELTKDFTDTQKKAFESQKKAAIETSEAIVKAAEEAWNKETAKQRDEINKQIDLVNQLRQAALDAKNILLELLGQPVDNRQATVTPQLTVPTQTGQTSQGKEPPLSYGAGLNVGGNVTWNGIVWRWNGKGWDYVKSASEGSLPPQTTPGFDKGGLTPGGANRQEIQGSLMGDIINQVTGITKDGAVQTGVANAFGMLGLGQIAGQSFKDTVKDNLVGKDGKGGLAAEMPGFGKTIVEMLAEGITNNVNILRDAVDKLTLEISLQLEPHSPPKQGRLHTIDKWMPKIVQLLAGGSLSDSDIRKPFLILADKIASSLGVGLDFGIIQAARQFKKSYTNNMNPLIASIEGGNANTFYQTSEAGKQQVWDMYNQDQSKVNDFNAFLAALNLRPGGNFSDFEKGGKFADTEMARIFANNREFDWQNGTDGKIGLGTNMAKGLLESTWFKALTPKLTDEQMLGKYGQFWKQNTPKMNAFTGYDLNSLQTMLPYLNQSDSKNDSFYKILSRIYYNMRELDNPNAKFSNLEQFLGVNLQQGPLDKGVLQYQINSPYAYEKYDLMMNEGAKSQAANEAANQAWRARNGIQMRPAVMDSSYAQGYDDWSRAMTLQGKWSGSDFESYDAYARKNKTYIDNSLNRVARDQAGYYETQKGGDYYNAGVSNDAAGGGGTNIIYYVSINIDGDNLDSSGIVDKVFEELDARSMNYSA